MYVQREESVHICFVYKTKKQMANDTSTDAQLKGRSCSETRQPCSPRQQWCRQPALGYRQPSTEKNKQPTERKLREK